MNSVTQRIKSVKQPRGGYLKPRDFLALDQNDGIELEAEENPTYQLIGITVDYMTRYMLGVSPEESFRISLLGAAMINQEKQAAMLLSQISKGLDDSSIISAYTLTGYDVCLRMGSFGYRPVSPPEPAVIVNIRTMVNRSLTFLQQYGPVIMKGFTFRGGYTDMISSGDGDYLTKDTLWDLKVSKKPPNKDHTLQLLIYYLMGKHSIHPEFQSIKNLGIFNPRLNKIYLLKVDSIDQDVIDYVSTEIIGYEA